MVNLILKIVCIVVAAICKATADTISPRKSQLSKKGDFWNITKQGKFFPFTKYPMDGWHIFNSAMIVAFIVSGVFTVPYQWYYVIPTEGILFIIVFNLFYNKVLT